ncbi:type III toxin-antitoxin system ToxN/AbiQ family toxin [Megamonas sp.]
MKENIDIYKIKNGELGVINFNNMIPVNDRLFTMVDLSKIKQVSYRYLMLEQLRIFNDDY